MVFYHHSNLYCYVVRWWLGLPMGTTLTDIIYVNYIRMFNMRRIIKIYLILAYYPYA
jgi:hypothetical protein